MTFDDIRIVHQRDWLPENRFSGSVLAFDPGETTGVCHAFIGPNDTTVIQAQEQIKSWPLDWAVKGFEQILSKVRPNLVVFERYGVYSWKTESHTNSDIPTLQVIGCLKTLCIQHNIPHIQQTAQIAKQFITDDKLQRWGFDPKGKRHARDATRHALYFLLFGNKEI